MELSLPNKFGSTTNVILNTRVLVVIGTNGAGKSSFGKSLLDKYPDKAEKVSGLHALFLNNGEEKLFKNIGEGFAHLQSLVKERLLVPRLSDYEKLVLGLLWDEFEQSANFKENYKINPDTIPPVTKIDQIQQIWEKMFPHNRLVRKAGFIELMSTYEGAESYTAGRMSDSEKLVFYLIGTILQAREEAILIIEEPETLLHNSIKTYLWDELEKLRPDCTFVYLTHDIDFAVMGPRQRCAEKPYRGPSAFCYGYAGPHLEPPVAEGIFAAGVYRRGGIFGEWRLLVPIFSIGVVFGARAPFAAGLDGEDTAAAAGVVALVILRFVVALESLFISPLAGIGTAVGGEFVAPYEAVALFPVDIGVVPCGLCAEVCCQKQRQ